MRWAVLCVAAVLAIAMVWLLSRGSDDRPRESTGLPTAAIQPETSAGGTMADPSRSDDREDEQNTQEPLADAVWQEAKAGIGEDLFDREVEGRVVIRIDKDRLLSVREGDPLSVRVPQESRSFAGVVESRTVHGNGDVSLVARLAPGGPGRAAVFTIGRNETYATIGVPGTVYNMTGKDGLGWIAPGRAFGDHTEDDQVFRDAPGGPH